MPRTEVLFFQDDDDSVPLMDWLASLSNKARAKCVVRLERLEELGHELRRPEADYLRDDIYGRRAVVLSHGFSKQQSKVPAREIVLASRRKQRFERDPIAHTFKPEG